MRTLRSLSRMKTIAWVILITLSLHGFIPAGYMPDFSGHGWLVICDGSDHMSAPSGPGHGGQMDPAHCPHHGHTLPCPFSAGAIYGFSGISAPVILPPDYALAAESQVPESPRLQRPAFSNVSPRSPPFFS